MKPQLLTLADVAQAAGLTVGSARVMRCRGKLPPETHRIGNRPMWRKSTVDAWLRRRGQATRLAAVGQLTPGMLTMAGIAARMGSTKEYVRKLRHQDKMPIEDGWAGRRPVWAEATITGWLATRPHRVSRHARPSLPFVRVLGRGADKVEHWMILSA